MFTPFENELNNTLVSFTASASYAQERFNSQTSQHAIQNMLSTYRLSTNTTASIAQLRRALRIVVQKHQCLRTALFVDPNENRLMQRINESDDDNQLFAFVQSTFETDEQLHEIMHDEQVNANYFNLSCGLVFRCHIVQQKSNSSSDLLGEDDIVIFNFHRNLIDKTSLEIFHHDLAQAYTNEPSVQDNNNDDATALRYIDCKFITPLFERILNCIFLYIFRCRR